MSTNAGATLEGIYYGNNPADLVSAQTWLGGPVGIIAEHTGRASWSDWIGSIGWLIGQVSGIGTTKRWSIPLFANQGNLKDAAAGSYNSYYVQAAQKLVAAYGTSSPIIVRTGEEFNASWMPWSATSDPTSYIKAYQNFVDAFRSVSSNFKFEWTVNIGGSMDPSTAYPGDKYVDYVSMDFYWDSTQSWSIKDPTQAFNYFKNEKYGLQWLEDFATAHGKQSAYGEWGVNSSNASAYLTLVKQWFDSNHPAYEIYWDSNADFAGKMDNGAYGAASDTFKALFGTPVAAASSATTSGSGSAATSVASSAATAASSTATHTGTLGTAVAGYYHDYQVSTSGGVVTITKVATQDVLTGSVTQTAFTDGILTFDPNSDAAMVMRLYDSVLHRAPDAVGLDYWVHAIENGQSFASVANNFLTSNEFLQSTNTLSNADYTDYLYQHALGRASDPGGKAYWVSLLDAGASRADVLVDFSESAEHRALTAGTLAQGLFDTDQNYQAIAALYDTFAGRKPDATGLQAWATTLKSGSLSLSQVSADFAASSEFTHDIAGMTHMQVVDYLYENALHRAPDAVGEAAWTSALDHGLSYGDLLLDFSQSPEHLALIATSISGGILL